jgi:hypothetical protein
VSASSVSSSISLRAGDSDVADHGREASLQFWVERPRRVLYLLAGVWVLNFLDLGLTLTESNGRLFRELNPVAAHMLDEPLALVMYKASLVWIGSWILLRFRSRRLTELACWFLLATYGYVGLRWQQYYSDVMITLHDPCVIFEAQACCAVP